MKRRVKFWLWANLFAVLLLMLPLSTLAQEATSEADSGATQQDSNLRYGSPVTGAIDNTTYSQTWTLQTASADRLSIEVERTDGNLIPEVMLLDANGQQLGGRGTDETGARAVLENLKLPVGGNYQVVVQRAGAETGVTTGNYNLTVIPLATAEDNPNNTLVIGPVEYDVPIQGELTATQWVSLYSLEAPAADRIQVRVERSSGTLFPEVDVRDVNGTSLTRGYVDNSGTFAETNAVALPASGQFTVAVTRQGGFNGDTVGGYVLIVKLLGAGAGSPSLQSAAGTVEYDMPLTGSISNSRWYEDWSLSAQAGDSLRITVERSESAEEGTTGNLQPEVVLLGGSGQDLRRGYIDSTGSRAVIDRYQLDGPGSYTVRVTRRSDQTGVTAGGYVLTVHLIGSGKGSPNLTSITGTITKGTPITGEITPARWADSWTYEATKDERIDIQVTRIEGTLIPQIEIQDSNGQSVRTIYPEQSRDTAVVRNYAFPGTGQYRIVVLRDRDQNGLTTGTYNLTVSDPEQ